MATRQPRYSAEETARRGDEIYEREIGPRAEAENRGRFVAIDIESGAYEMADDELTACHRLLARYPAAEIWLRRVGYRALHRFGPRDASERP